MPTMNGSFHDLAEGRGGKPYINSSVDKNNTRTCGFRLITLECGPCISVSIHCDVGNHDVFRSGTATL